MDATEYSVVVHHWWDQSSHWWAAFAEDIPEIVGQGDTEEEACADLLHKLSREPIH